MSTRFLTTSQIVGWLGPVRDLPPLEAKVEGVVECDGYARRHVTYGVPGGRASAFVCIPDGLTSAAPLVFCHHQHAGRFDLGKSEVCGLLGDPDQAYAAELAQRGFVTIAPDAIGFEDRNWTGDENISWFELSSRIVSGRTLLADCLQEISAAVDYACSLPEVDSTRVGFIGHSYGGRAAIWAPVWDSRFIASVSNCGCIPYRESFARDAGFQAEFVVPGFAAQHDVEDVLGVASHCEYLILATDNDRWSRGAAEIRERLRAARAQHVEVEIRPGTHDFPRPARERAYTFLERALTR